MKIQNPYLRATLCLRLLAIALMLALSPSLFAQTNTTACTAAAIDCSSTPNLKSYSNPTTLPTGPTCAGANSPNFALWYTFTATQSSASLTITGGNFFDPTKTGIVLYKSTDGTCNNLSYVNCIPSTSSMTAFTNFSVTKGATYFVAVYSTTVYSKNATWTLCLTQPPANDEPVDALKASYVLTSGTSCTTQTFTLVNATASSGIPAGSEPTANSYYDVWFSFVANGPVETITLSNLGNSITSRAIELYSGSPGSLTPIAYASATTLTSTGLTVGTTYFIRVSNYGTAPITTNGSFDICVYYPKPSNDDCSGAKSISTSSTCSNTAGTLFAATPSTGLPVGCESTGTHYDVWYSFTAAGNTEVINLSSLGAGITNPEVQIYKGNCGSLTSVACVSGAANFPYKATNLTKGVIYYVRVSNVGTDPTLAGATFNICIYHPYASVDYSRSYVNISKGSSGGTVDPGDTLEMRLTFVVSLTSADSLSFEDTIYRGSGLRYVPGSLALRTNEGTIYKGFTDDATDTDAGWIQSTGSNPDTLIHMNFGAGATASRFSRGQLLNTSRPSIFNSTCIIMATYRVVVNGAYNTLINFKTGALTYRDPAIGVVNKITFPTDNLIVYQSPGLCPNAISVSNAIGAEYNGTFGKPDTTAPLARNRGTSAYTNYNYAQFSATGGPNDYFYGVANNTSQIFTILNNWGKPESHRVFNLWDITGDHTGASNTASGNPPCDTTKPVSASNPCGYLLVINSAYKADTAFTYNVTNLCPNTYYEIAAWFKNMCYKCGCDSTGLGATSASYLATTPGDSSGVKPNIAFDVNGIDYYTTGDIKYSGTTPTTSDATNKWVKRGFTYLTGPSQTSFTLTLRNNAPGGGGNDWALDDIGVNTCLPNMQYSPTLNPVVCSQNIIQVNDTIRSYFSNYQFYKWQRSADQGLSWTDVAGADGTATPAWNGSSYQFITSYTIPDAYTQPSNNGDQYRVIVGTASSNMSNSSCQVTDGVSQISLQVQDCNVLGLKLISFNGKVINHFANLAWTTSSENELYTFTVQKSTDQVRFVPVRTFNGQHLAGINYYNFTDSNTITGKVWYRIDITDRKSHITYSRIIQLEDANTLFDVTNIINPFSNNLQFDVNIDQDARLDLSLLTLTNSMIRKMSIKASSGTNSYSIPDLNKLPTGIYLLQISYQNKTILRKVVKK